MRTWSWQPYDFNPYIWSNWWAASPDIIASNGNSDDNKENKDNNDNNDDTGNSDYDYNNDQIENHEVRQAAKDCAVIWV